MTTVTYYQTRRLFDMTEGRGPMINDLAFTEYRHAEAYINSQPGVMGRRCNWTQERHASDWDIQTVHARTEASDPQEEARQRALAKLTKEERKLLGL